MKTVQGEHFKVVGGKSNVDLRLLIIRCQQKLQAGRSQK
jgi:hypothetical protein